MRWRGLSASVLLVGAAFAAHEAHAVNKGNVGKFGVVQTGRTASLTNGAPPVNSGGSTIPVSPNAGGWTFAGNYGVPPGAVPPTGGTLTASGHVVFRDAYHGPGQNSWDVGGVKYPFQASTPIPWGALAPVAAGVICTVTSAGWCGVAAGLASQLPGIAEWLKDAEIERNPDGGFLEQVEPNTWPQSDGYQYRAYYNGPQNTTGWYSSKQLAAEAMMQFASQLQGSDPWTECGVTSNGGRWFCRSVQYPAGSHSGPLEPRAAENCPAGQYITPIGCTSNPDRVRHPLSPEALAEALRNATPKDGRPWGEVLDRGGEVPMDSPTVSGPSSVTGPQKEVSRPDGSRDVTTPTYHFTTNNNQVTNTHITNVTTHYNSSNVQTGTTTETVTPTDSTPGPSQGTDGPQAEEEPPPVDTPLGELPKLYERKYPDGIVGVWGDFKDRLSGSSLAQFASGLMPGFDSGVCPEWPVGLDFGEVGFGVTANFGTHDVAPPCWVWDALRAILIVCALLLARALIFGG